MLKVYIFVVLLATAVFAEDYVHDPLQYQSLTDRGSYNFGYDTGLKGAHSLRQERKDEAGVIRGRYGYTDPNGKLRMVYYEAGPKGFKAWGDVGPDGFGTGEFPGVPPAAPAKPAKYSFAANYKTKDLQRLSRSTTTSEQVTPQPTQATPVAGLQRKPTASRNGPSRYYFRRRIHPQPHAVYLRREPNPVILSRRLGIPIEELNANGKATVVFTNNVSHDVPHGSYHRYVK